MANAVREDVIRITWDVAPFPDVTSRINTVTGTAQKAASSVSGIGKSFSGVGNSAVSAASKTSRLASGIKSLPTKVATTLASGVKGLGKALAGISMSIFNKIKAGFSKIGAAIKALPTKLLEKLKDTLKKVGEAAAGALKKMAAFSAKTALAGVAALGTGFVALTKASVEAGSSLEQNIGGIQKLLGTDGAKSVEEYAKAQGTTVDKVKSKYKELSAVESSVMQNAKDAYKTAGLSANDYMAEVTSFAASLKQTLNPADAAKAANTALIDMANNANKMGTDLSSIQNAYQGFSKQNYTMLDNLKLGYGGTKQEMQRLITDASKMTAEQKKLGVTVDANSMSFGNIVNAIHVMQGQMGILGTTEKEATTTFEGSQGMMKAAWQNLLGDMALGEQGVNSLGNDFSNLGTSVGYFLQNLSRMVGNVTKAIPQFISSFSAMVPDVMKEFSPIIDDVISMIPEAVPAVIDAAGSVINAVLTSLTKNLPKIAKAVMDAIPQILTGIQTALPQIASAGLKVVQYLVNGAVQNLPQVLQIGMEAIQYIVQAVQQNLPQIITAGLIIVQYLIVGILQELPTIIVMGVQALTYMIQGITQMLPQLAPVMAQSVQMMIQGLAATLPALGQAGLQLIQYLGQSIEAGIPVVAAEAPKAIYEFVKNFVANLPTILKTIGEGIVWVIENIGPIILDGIKSIGKGVVDGVKSWFKGSDATEEAAKTGESAGKAVAASAQEAVSSTQIKLPKIDTSSLTATSVSASPSISISTSGAQTAVKSVKATLDGADMSQSGQKMMTTLTNGIKAGTQGLSQAVQSITDSLKTAFGSVSLYDSGANLGQGFLNGLLSKEGAILSEARRLATSVSATVNKSLDIHSPSKVAQKSGQFYGTGLAKGLTKSQGEVARASVDVANVVRGTADPSSGGTYATTNNSSTTNNSYAPVFTLNMNGASATRGNEMKMRKWLREEMAAMFADLGNSAVMG